ncbi:hypothetical protein Lesp02_40160 [Lentzea sp. NBRC 105346]|uniref:hypothetical protein n=1 Tax=Lentzea sp. NBRC 105346 TaxID=3032205 RepID=UPI0024A58AC9|nr:hypothetical protein [Lentzea sp. NBRC 105346]GLZ31828.1 hypothetical protein Lesp02_40160 [Lentzea sp. NBRC 105346]
MNGRAGAAVVVLLSAALSVVALLRSWQLALLTFAVLGILLLAVGVTMKPR